MRDEKIELTGGEYIRLCDAVKLSGCCDTGGMAKLLIQSGKVYVNGEICLMRGKKLRAGDKVSLEGAVIEISGG